MNQKLRKIMRVLFPSAIVFSLLANSVKILYPAISIFLPWTIAAVWFITAVVIFAVLFTERKK